MGYTEVGNMEVAMYKNRTRKDISVRASMGDRDDQWMERYIA